MLLFAVEQLCSTLLGRRQIPRSLRNSSCHRVSTSVYLINAAGRWSASVCIPLTEVVASRFVPPPRRGVVGDLFPDVYLGSAAASDGGADLTTADIDVRFSICLSPSAAVLFSGRQLISSRRERKANTSQGVGDEGYDSDTELSSGSSCCASGDCQNLLASTPDAASAGKKKNPEFDSSRIGMGTCLSFCPSLPCRGGGVGWKIKMVAAQVQHALAHVRR